MASQAAAFAAIDQSILARKVGIPGKVEPIPLDLGKKKPTLHMPPPKDDDNEGGDEQQEVDGDGEEPEQDAVPETPSGETAGAGSLKRDTEKEERKATVSHVITNVIVLQSFLFELAALIQVRAALFNEVRYA